MSDSEPTFLHDAIMEVLPELPAVTRNILEEHLESIGVETYDDLRFVEEADWMTVRPENSSLWSVEASPAQSLSLLPVSPQSSSSSTSSSSSGLDTRWENSFETPWTLV
ncbi:hypothetical protein GOODEAATRI_024875 [Goodea atripinnis]|uniref:Uncharacterized protein n=1 Tax=Goodea atripinnis TaxID=208336 RepID=A0ABV0P7J7_9TELE